MHMYLKALRAWSLTASGLPVLLGNVLAYRDMSVQPAGTDDSSRPSVLILVLTLICVSFVHMAGNLINTYYDYKYGVDQHKQADDRTLVDHFLQPSEVSTLCLLFYSISLVSFLAVALLSSLRLEYSAFLFFVGLSGSFLYTGGMGFKYYALGDILVLALFGPMAVTFSYMLQTGTFAIKTALFAAPLAFGTEAILHCNNTRDIETDRRAGIRTIAIVLGREWSYVLFCFLLFTPYIILSCPACKISMLIFLPYVTINEAFAIELKFRTQQLDRLPERIKMLTLKFGLLYVSSILISFWIH
ncbi:ubiA prenyltransferase domain-containing protein 1-like [Symsagittifera roscoffensis]|uniref:ubiA prenyltransferase domain-containing protein 1-like n=1 Tax=Symsagittifera roscoffensis TaxID=84072 RepID=UPI00307B6463